MENSGDPYFYLFKQATWALLGLVLVPLDDAHRLPHLPAAGGDLDRARRSSALALVAVLFGHTSERRDAAGSASAALGVQPSELAKIVVIVFIAALLERRMDRIDEPAYALLPIGVVLGVIVGADSARAGSRARRCRSW